MRLRPIKNLDQKLEQISYLLSLSDLESFDDLFAVSQDLYLEIGMGKGGFLYAMAQRHPDRNFLGIDRSDGIVLKASQSMEERPNMKLLIGDFEKIEELFPSGVVSGIFLNFSDPWPKKRHHKRRLTNRRFLDFYDRVLKPGGFIWLKTDSKDLFEYSLEEFADTGRELFDVTWDLHQDERYPDNIPTEYETKFSSLGYPIHGLRYVKRWKNKRLSYSS